MANEREIAFLKSLLTEEDNPPTRTPCPEPTILWLLTQPQRPGDATVQHLREHIGTCASCCDLASCLQVFAKDTEPGEETLPAGEWERARPLLRRRMEAFLDAQPSAKSLQAARPVKESFWRMPRFSWGLHLKMAGCALAVLLVGVVEFQRSNRPGGFLTGEINPEAAHSAADKPLTAPGSGDQPVLMNDRSGSSSSDTNVEPESLSFTAGEQLRLTVSSVSQLPDGTYEVEGRLLPRDAAQGTLDTSEITGILTPATGENSASLLIQEIALARKLYRPLLSAEEQQLVAHMVLENEVLPHVGETVRLEVLSTQFLRAFEP
jgi:hypothetical protein